MNAKSILTDADHDEFLVYLYFGDNDDYLMRCIHRAYLDFSRTLHGIGQLRSGEHLRVEAQLHQIFANIQASHTEFAGQAEFDRWHQTVCEQLRQFYSECGYSRFTVGQAQKWINMTFKYIYTLGQRRVPGFEAIYPFCHAPLDNILIDRLGKYGFSPLPRPWSRLNDYAVYLDYQQKIRQRFNLVPLDVEFFLWLRGDIPITPRH